MAGGAPTILDVAQRAGVSKALVSAALNDRPGVSSDSRSRILRAADDLGWRPSLPARSLSTRTSYAVGLVIARDPKVIGVDPFFPGLIAGVESVLAPLRRALVLSVVEGEDAELDAYRSFARDRRVDGVLLTDLRHDDARIALVASLGLPAVTLGRPACPSDLPAVVLDDSAGVRATVAHLADLGHRRIAHVAGPSGMLHGSRRRDAFLAAATELGMSDAPVVETDFSASDGARATRALLDRPDQPTAIVYANDPMAIAGLGVAQESGLRVPDDLSITGFDGTDIAQHVYPPLTTVASDPFAWGAAAARTLLARVDAESVPSVELDPARLVVRGSTGPAPADDRTPVRP